MGKKRSQSDEKNSMIKNSFIERGDVYVGDGNRRVRVGAVFTDKDGGGRKVTVYHLGPQGGRENMDYDEFNNEFEKE